MGVNTQMKKSLSVLFLAVCVLWLIQAINAWHGYALNSYGILPRATDGLIGVLAGPFLHASFMHLLNNSVAFIMLGALVSLSRGGKYLLLKLTIFLIVWGGLSTWLFARQYYHVGLSGVIFGYWGFLTINGVFEKSLQSILLSLFAIVFYGGMIFGVFPTSEGISFEGHIFGALCGVMYSYLYRGRSR